MMCLGQALVQAPQAVHLLSSTTGRPVSGSIDRAPNWQAATQSPQPRQPKAHPVSPLYRAALTRQDCTPSYSLIRGRAEQVPLQRTTATCGAFAATVKPKIEATFCITSSPPTGQYWLSRLVALTAASAKARHPAKPQPPQLAPGITFSTSSILGSSSTLNLRATQNRMSASNKPRTVRMATVQIKVCVIIYLILNTYSFRRRSRKSQMTP